MNQMIHPRTILCCSTESFSLQSYGVRGWWKKRVNDVGAIVLHPRCDVDDFWLWIICSMDDSI